MGANVVDDLEIPVDLLERALALPAAAMMRFSDLLREAAGPADDPELYRQEMKALIADRIEGYLSGRYKTVDAREMAAQVREQLLKDFPQ